MLVHGAFALISNNLGFLNLAAVHGLSSETLIYPKHIFSLAMVLESIVSVRTAERKPWEMLPIGFTYVGVASLLSLWLFPAQASVASVLFVVVAGLPLMLGIFQFEEFKSKTKVSGHEQVWPFFIFLFVGMVGGYVAMHLLLPAAQVQNLFFAQQNAIEHITGNAIGLNLGMQEILLNNLKVLAVAAILSVLYGAGAIFILAWNASTIAAAIGAAASHSLAGGLAYYLLHGIPEIGAYFLAGLAGGIISFAIIRHDYKTKKFKKVLWNAADIMLAAIILLIVSAFIEVNISPLI